MPCIPTRSVIHCNSSLPPNILVVNDPNNSDATFLNNTQVPKPSDLLLHYNYGAAVVAKLGAARDAAAGSGTGSGSGARIRSRTVVVDSDGKDLWDEDDTMLFFWGNSKAALERHHRREVENNQNMEEWRQTVSQN